MKQTIKPEDCYPEDVTERRFSRLLELMVTGRQTCPEKSPAGSSTDCTDTGTPSHTSTGVVEET